MHPLILLDVLINNQEKEPCVKGTDHIIAYPSHKTIFRNIAKELMQILQMNTFRMDAYWRGVQVDGHICEGWLSMHRHFRGGKSGQNYGKSTAGMVIEDCRQGMLVTRSSSKRRTRW